jgi:ferredoxin
MWIGFGGGHTLKYGAGTSAGRMVTEDDCIRALEEAAQLLGDSPTKAQYEALDLTPAASTILRQCGGWTDAKRLAGLETNHSRGSRVAPKPDGVDLPEGLVWDELSQDQRWHYRNREWNTERSLQRRRLRLWVNERKVERGCKNCEESDPACLDYHDDGTTKVESISHLISNSCSVTELRGELRKCIVLCANCHRREHYQGPLPE